MEQNSKEFIDRSQDAQEIINYKPGILELLSIYIFTFAVIIFLIILFFFPFYEKVQSKATFKALVNPSEIVCQDSGVIKQINENMRFVKVGDTICIIQRYNSTNLVITTSINGVLSIVPHIKNGIEIKQNDLIGVINPIKNFYYSELSLSQMDALKIKTGMIVYLKIPSSEGNSIEGRVEFISTVPYNGFYKVIVTLNDRMAKNFGSLVGFKSGIDAEATIFLKRNSLFKKLKIDASQ